MDLIAPASTDEVREALRDASGHGTRVGIVGGRAHAGKGNACETDRELSIDALHRVIAYDPAEMLAVIEGGMRIGELRETLAEGGQEWPVDAPDEATVGGVVATAPTSPRRLRFGPLRDTVVEIELVTGDAVVSVAGASVAGSKAPSGPGSTVTGSSGDPARPVPASAPPSVPASAPASAPPAPGATGSGRSGTSGSSSDDPRSTSWSGTTCTGTWRAASCWAR